MDAAQVKHVVLPQRLSTGGTGQQNLRGGQVFHVGFHGHAVLQVVLCGGKAVRQQTAQGTTDAGQGDKGGDRGFGGTFQQAVLQRHIGGVFPQHHTHGGDKRRDNGALGPVDSHGACFVVGQVDADGQVAALAQQVFQRGGFTVQGVGHGGGNRQGTAGVALIVDIGVGGVPGQAVAVLGERGVALGIDDIGQGGAVGDAGEAGRVVEVGADRGTGDRAVRGHDGVHRLVFGEAGLGGGKGGQGHPGSQRQRQGRAGKAKCFFHGRFTPFQTSEGQRTGASPGWCGG